MRAVRIALLLFGLLGIFGALDTAFANTQQANSIKPFSDWKSEKVQAISNKILAAKNQAETYRLKKKTDPSLQPQQADSNISYYEKIAQQEQWNLEVVQELGITDYLVLYLAGQSSQNKYQDAAAKLTVQDVADLMEAYVRVTGVSVAPAMNQAHGVKKQPLPTQAIQAKELIK